MGANGRQELRVPRLHLDGLGPEEPLVEGAARLEVRDVEVDVYVAHRAPTHELTTRHPTFEKDQGLDAGARTSSRILAYPFDRFPFRILERPVVAPQPGNDRALLSTTHR